MNDPLLPPDAGQADSPRLAWCKRLGLTVDYMDMLSPAYRHRARAIAQDLELGFGPTEDDALADWARRNGVCLWNKEAAT